MPKEKTKVRTRIAPSPTGSPHIGTAYAALFNYCFAKQNSGDFVLRIEDTDRARLVEGSEEEIYEALKWLGLEPDESPKKEGKFGPYRQSERLAIYRQQLENLVKEGKAYYCDCSPDRLEKLRKEQLSRGEAPHYDQKCRQEPPKKINKVVVRLAVPQTGETVVEDKIHGKVVFQNNLIDDQVLLKSDGYPTYHLASVVDDHLMEISHVIRAEEWLSSTPKHVLLYQAFGWNLPEFAHLPLLRNPDRSKISKRKNPVAINFYREQGYLPEALLNFLGLMGWSMPDGREIFSLDEMVKNFTFERVDPSGPVFDIDKLSWLNGEYIRKLSDRQLLERLKPYTKYSPEQVLKVVPLVKERLKKLSEFNSLTSYFFEEQIDFDPKLAVIKNHSEETVKIYEDIKQTFTGLEPWDKNSLEKALEVKPQEYGVSKTELFQSIRGTVTGGLTSPPLYDTLEMIGKERVVSRIGTAVEELK